ncbi:hypothetical protein [Variovorax sp.]|uniref:hypothetical protein n=1 Tax=Variovorax sp. TaxID=1871043 RepID=UPI003BACDF5A
MVTPTTYKSVPRNCLHCGAEFQARVSKVLAGAGKFCSAGCYAAFNRTWVSRDCQHCGQPFKTWHYKLERGHGKYCSLSCATGERAGGCAWSPAEDALLRDLYPQQRTSDVVALLGRTRGSVESRAEALQLRKSSEYYLAHGLTFHAYPQELKDILRLLNRLKRRIRERQEPV